MRKYSIVPCAYCGREFHQLRPDNRYCSQSCYHSARWGTPITAAGGDGKIDIICRQCGRVFRDWPSQRRMFCSDACRAGATRNRIAHVCERCGKTFERPASVRASRWCSRLCYDTVRVDPSNMEEQFWSRVDRTSPDGCWPWTGSRIKTGYGYYGKPKQLAHRLAWQYSRHTTIARDMVVMHLCDNPSCCRPEHLSLGTQADNLADMRRKGRARWSRNAGEDVHDRNHVQMSLLV